MRTVVTGMQYCRWLRLHLNLVSQIPIYSYIIFYRDPKPTRQIVINQILMAPSRFWNDEHAV